MQEAEIISINKGITNPLVTIAGKSSPNDHNFKQIINLGEIDNVRRRGVDAAYAYLSGKPGEYRVNLRSEKVHLKLFIIGSIMFIIGIAAGIFCQAM
jgi:hypothetical protein